MRFVWAVLAMLPGLMAHAGDTPPSPPREFRGVWVATVANIDWPSTKGLSSKQQQAELLAIFDKCVELKLNAVVLHVRPMCDALYASKLEPWSEYLTGALGKAPAPYYDPLEFAVKEAHARGLELHAWFNPYRARHPSATSPIPDDHLVKRRPDLAKLYGKHHWLNPTHAKVQDHSLKVILDVVRRYDIDGVHMDDYFYPYKEKDADGKVMPFPDDDTWAEFQRSARRQLSRDDWRRDAVNRFVQRLYREVKEAKPWVKVGISPFGIWRPGHPPGIAGFDQYAELYADAKLWLNEGWVDYFTPQLYWPIKQDAQSYPKLLGWWAQENTKGRHLWPGNAAYRAADKEKGWFAGELADQVRATRALKGATGNIHFSMKSLMRNTGGAGDALKTVYAVPALTPVVTWMKLQPPAKPQVEWREESGQRVLRIRQTDDAIRRFVVRSRTGDTWSVRIHPAERLTSIAFAERPDRVLVSTVDRLGIERSLTEQEK